MVDRHVALYARVSTEQQARDATIASQLAALREHIAADGRQLEPDRTYLDEGCSGSSLLRPALERLRDAVAAGDIERLYVHAPDRLARRHAHQALLMEEFRRAGVEVVFLNRPIGGTAEDDLLLQIQGVIAEYERARILERSRRGRRHAARAGLVSAFTTAPFGYRYVTKDQGGGVARFEAMPEEAPIVRLIFAWVGLERLSLREVCRRLERAGCPTRRGSARWYASTVRGMLANTAYIGRAVYGHSRFLPARPRLRPIRGHPRPSPRPTARVAVPREEWIEVPYPRWSIRPCSRPSRRSSARTAGASGTGGAAPGGRCRARRGPGPAVGAAGGLGVGPAAGATDPGAQRGRGAGPPGLPAGLAVGPARRLPLHGQAPPGGEAGPLGGGVPPLPLHRYRRLPLRRL